MSEETQPIRDTRASTHGWPRILLMALAVGAVIFSWRGIVASTAAFQQGEIAAALTTLLADLIWVAGTVGIIHNGLRMRRFAGVSWTINVVVPIVAFFIDSDALVPVNPWYGAGSTYFFLPLVGAVAAVIWLIWSAPSQIATRNGG